MPVEVVMPRLSDTMEEGKVLKWRRKEGEEVKKGEVIAEIETDKAAMELESFDTGVVSRILVPEGQTVPVGEPIAMIAAPAERPAPAPPTAKKEEAPPARAEVAAAAPAPAPPPPAEEKVKASPLARRIAEERGIDLSQVKGTGPEGRVTKEDVLAYIKEKEELGRARPAPPAPPAPAIPAPREEVEFRELTRMQATIAERMTRAKQTIPHFYVTVEVDVTEASRMLGALKATGEDRLDVGYTDLIVKATALALRRFPIVNAFYHNGTLQYNKSINIGIAVALPDGLMVPVVHDCDKKSLREISTESRQLVDRVRAGHLIPSDFEGGTFTVSNLGKFDVDEFAAIINPPESAILAIGSVRQTPVVRDSQIVVAETMRVTLSADHRVYYGATAAQFLQEFKRLLENPITMVL